MKLQAGTPYTINTIPNAAGWQIVFGKLDKPKQWGIPYQEKLEIGKAPMTLGKAAAPVEQRTISIDDTAAGARCASSGELSARSCPSRSADTRSFEETMRPAVNSAGRVAVHASRGWMILSESHDPSGDG